VEVGLSILGAIIDAALFASGVTAGMATMPWFYIMCLDPVRFVKPDTSKNKALTDFKADNVNVNTVTAMKAAAKDTVTGEPEGRAQAAYIQYTTSGCVQDSSLGGAYSEEIGPGCEASLLQLGDNSTSTGTRTLRSLRAGEEVEMGNMLQLGVEFLYNFIIEVLANSDLVSAEDKGIADTIFWILMRLWEGMCGQFGTAVMNVVKELALCNMCAVCPPSACTIKIFSFTEKCRAHYALAESDASTSKRSVHDARSTEGWGGYSVDYSVALPAEEGDAFENMVGTVTGNDGNTACHDWCKGQRWTGGAYGAVFTEVRNNAGNVQTMELFADMPFHVRQTTMYSHWKGATQSFERSTGPCCPNGGANACNACVCKGPYVPPHSHSPHGHWPHGHRPHVHVPHGHWPHGHRPHSHRPHSHNPHGHNPHGHWPHGHNPHGHWPHGHWPHGHWPHGHRPGGW